MEGKLLMLIAEQPPFSVVAREGFLFPNDDEMLVTNSRTDTNQNSALPLITYVTQAQLSAHIKFLFLPLNIRYSFIYTMYSLGTYFVPRNVLRDHDSTSFIREIRIKSHNICCALTIIIAESSSVYYVLSIVVITLYV